MRIMEFFFGGGTTGELTFHLAGMQSQCALSSKPTASTHLLMLTCGEALCVASSKMPVHTDKYRQTVAMSKRP